MATSILSRGLKKVIKQKKVLLATMIILIAAALGAIIWNILPAEAVRKTVWQTPATAAVHAVAAADIDGDNVSEVVYGGQDSKLYVRKYIHATRLTEPYQTFGITAGMSPEIIKLRDLDGDGKQEIIIAGPDSNRVEAYTFINNTLAQLFSVPVSANVLDLAVGQFTDANGNTGIDVAAVTSANKMELVYNDADTWKTGFTANTAYQARRVESFVYDGAQDALVVTTVYGVRTFLFEGVDNPPPVWEVNGVVFDGATYNVFAPLAVSGDIVDSSNSNGTDGIPEIVVGTQDLKAGKSDIIVTLNGRTGAEVWTSTGGKTLGRINDIKVQAVGGAEPDRRYVTVGTGAARDAGGNPAHGQYVLLFEVGGSGLNNPNFKRATGDDWRGYMAPAGEVLAVYLGYIDHSLTNSSGNTNIIVITGDKTDGTPENRVVKMWYLGSTNSLNYDTYSDTDNYYDLNTNASYTWSPRSTYLIASAAVNPQDNWRDVVFTRPGTGGAEVVSFDDKAPVILAVPSVSPNPVVNPWNNNVTISVSASEGCYVKAEVLRGSNGSVFATVGPRVADFNGTDAAASLVWDGTDGAGNRYTETIYKIKVWVYDNETQFDGNSELTLPWQSEARSYNTYPGTYSYYTVSYDSTSPELTLGLYKDINRTIPLSVYNGKPITRSGSPVYLKITGSEALLPDSVFYSVYDVHPQAVASPSTTDNVNFKGIWNLDLPAEDGTAVIQAEGRDPGGNTGTVTREVIVDNTATQPAVTATDNLNGKITLNISGIDPDHRYVRIYRSTVSGFTPNEYCLLASFTGFTANSFTDKNVQPNQNYYYRVQQVDYIENTAVSDEVSGKSLPGLTFNVDYYTDAGLTQLLPKNPDGRYVTNLRSPIYIKFTAGNPLVAAPAYVIDAPGSTANDITEPVTAAWVSGQVYQGTWGVTVPGNDGSASVKVTAADIFGQSLSDNVPAAGGTVVVDTTARTPHLWAEPGPSSVNLSWTRESDIKNTRIYRSTNPDFVPTDAGIGANLITAVSGTVYHNTDLDSEQTYYYKVIAVDCAGNVSAPSDRVSVQPEFAEPHPAPVIVRADPTNKQILYLVFDEPVVIRGNPAEWTVTQNVYGTPPEVTSAEVTDDRRIIRIILNGEQGTGNQLTPLTYTVALTGIEDDYGTPLPENGTANQVSWEAFSPHGKFSQWSGGTVPAGSATVLCGLCHSAHNASGSSLLPDTTIKRVCFICHSITGSSALKVEGEFVSRSVYGMPYSFTLHKSLDSDDPGYDVLSCVDCHNPHGDVIDKNTDNTIYPKLLRVTDAGGNKYYQGNQVCLACHGNIDCGFEDGTYYANTGGNHINPVNPDNINAPNTTGPVHYDNVNFADFLNPDSGTQITCVKCHEKHGSQYGSLLDNSLAGSEEALCFKSGCHGPENPAKNIYDQFLGASKVSRHDIGGTGGKGRVECTNCHGPHTVDNTNTAATAKISDPDNTKLAYSGWLNNDFCLKCHDGDPPQKTRTDTEVVPYTVSFDLDITTNGSGWNKSWFTNSGHYNQGFQTPRRCTGCHTWHGSQYLSLMTEPIDRDFNYSFNSSNSPYCLGLCHQASIGNSFVNTEVKTVFNPANSPYRHPTFDVNGVHDNTEDLAAKNVDRHAECSDCHDVHTSRADGTEQGLLGQVTGLDLTWSGDPWETFADAELVPLTFGAKQYLLCLKCHSPYSYNSPPESPSSNGSWQGAFDQTDIAMEFNPDNPAFHAVIGESKVPDFVYNDDTYDYGMFANSWTADSEMKCTDCHSYPGRRGPHGSPNRFILKGRWDNTTGESGTSNHLCFYCHDYDFYTGADPGSETVRSQFSREGNYNLHNSSGGSHGSAGCVQCHGAVPHGWNKEDSGTGGLSLVTADDPGPYSDGVGITAINSVNTIPGDWKGHGVQWSCQKSCH
ncbi:cytochrome c3 family protein [Phosphitispora fastidiosa]|uniref:cytochrome c3 family protein n=1 Tax=Phosphitispora fastidiosa TaxID=2837202 RepID=UPI001E4EAA25|nr:cytochrome c3 family protein [Phosphitispora fastidiosa]MBU7008051.1 putative CXXCH cytochrome family protein [Phosphitispora fastidiosa]